MKAKEMDQKFLVGMRLMYSDGGLQDGADILMELAELGHINSIEQLVYIFLRQEEFDVAENYIDYAKNKNDPLILHLKALLIEVSVGHEESIESFKKAVAAGSPHACRTMFNASIYNEMLDEATYYLDILRKYPDYFKKLRDDYENEPEIFRAVSITDLETELDELRAKLDEDEDEDNGEGDDDDEGDDNDEDNDEDDDDIDENSEIWIRYKKYALESKKSKTELKRSEPEYYDTFEKLAKLGLLDIWIEWTRAFELPQSEITERHKKIGDQWDYLHVDRETGEEFENGERLSIDSKYLPEEMIEDYLFNIESGACSISAKTPRGHTTELDEDDENRTSYYLSSRIDCLDHESSEECYESQCSAAAITVGSGFGDGVYQTAAYRGQDGQIESVIAFFYWFNENDEYFRGGLVNSWSGVGFLRNHIPIILGEIQSTGELTFGDNIAWAMSEGMNDLENYKRVTFQVPSDDYLIIGWINADNLDLDFNRTFILGAYRGSLKKYFLNLAAAYPIMKDFKKIFAEKGFTDC